MAKSDRNAKPTGSAKSWNDTVKGVVQGKAFRFSLAPPAQDRLSRPLVLAMLPQAPLPEESLKSRWRRFFGGPKTDRLSKSQRLVWRFHDTVDDLLFLLWPGYEASLGGARRRRVRARAESAGIAAVYHPYQLQAGFDLLSDLPEIFDRERRYLDELLCLALLTYREILSKRPSGALSFIAEAQEYFFSGYRIEKRLEYLVEDDEKLAACQQIYDHYAHGVQYYIYALMARESLPIENQLFMYFGNALYFKGRIEWNGKLLERALTKNLPSRQWVLFHALRDRTVLKQFQRDGEYAKQFRSMLRAFPEDMVLTRQAEEAKAANAAKQAKQAKLGAGGKHRFRVTTSKKH